MNATMENKNVNISGPTLFLSLFIMTETGPGVKSAEYMERIPIYITAALGMSKTPLTVNQLARKTGYHFDTVARHIKILLSKGTLKEVPKLTCRYTLAKGGK